MAPKETGVRPDGKGDRGRVVRVNGPLVEVEGLEGTTMMEMIQVGPRHLTAEVISLRPGVATAQVYEYTGGLQVGDEARRLRAPLSARLGPHLLGSTFDGLLRPLSNRPVWLEPGESGESTGRRWPFSPRCRSGMDLAPGALLGVVPTIQGFEHRVLVPLGTAGHVDWVASEAEVEEGEAVALVGGNTVAVMQAWPIRIPRPVQARAELSTPLLTGQRVIDLLFPIAKGATAAVPGGFGTGKTMLLQQILKWTRADVIVFVGCGERGNELADALADLSRLEDTGSGRPLIERTVVIANTSNMPVMAREASIYTGMTVAEFYRDMGYDTVLLADSTSRWAEALREFSSRNGELPAEEGYPAGLASALAAFYERAGRVRTLGGLAGSVTAIGAVSPPGGDMTEPVAAHTERFVRCLWSLDRDLAYARHYPAVAWRRSFSKDLAAVAAWHSSAGRSTWSRDHDRAVGILAECDRLAPLVELVGIGSLPGGDRVELLVGRLLREGVLQQNALSPNDATCGPAKQSALLGLVLDIYDRCLSLLQMGVPPSSLEELDLSDVVRLRDEVGPDDDGAVTARGAEILARLELTASSQ